MKKHRRHKESFNYDFDFDGEDNFYHATGIDDIAALTIFTFSALCPFA